MLTDGGGGGTSFEEDLDSVAPRSAPAGASEPPPPGGVGLGIRTVRLFGEAGPAPGVGGGGSGAGGGDAALDFKLAAAVLRTGGGGGASGSDEDEVSEVRLRDPRLPHSLRHEFSPGQCRAPGHPPAARAESFSDSDRLHGGSGSGAGLVRPRLTLQPAARAGPVPVTIRRPTIGSLLVSELRAGTGTPRAASRPPCFGAGAGRGLARVPALGTERARPRGRGRGERLGQRRRASELAGSRSTPVLLSLCWSRRAGLYVSCGLREGSPSPS